MKVRSCGFAVCVWVTASTGCYPLFRLNLATKKDPPPMIDYTGDEVIGARHGEFYYWFAEPIYGGPVSSRGTAEIEALGTTSSMFSEHDSIIFMQKDDRYLFQTDCFWQAEGVVRKAGSSGRFSRLVTAVGSDSDKFTMDCEVFDRMKAQFDAKQPQPAQ